jgi:hypothetical protein
VSLSEARAAAAAEAASLRSELETVRKERARQAGVVEALMRRSEELCADAGRARELEASNEALARGLEAQAGTLDRLLALNEELAGVANALSAAREAGGAPPGEAPAGLPEPLYEEEWELEEAEARARGEPPPKGWGAPSLNFVGLTTRSPAMTEANGWWFETVAPERLQPRDLHAAQLARRLGPAAR